MKPIKLTLQAYGPFATREVIDFTPAHDNSIFLMCGPIGSGKSVVLDAIGFALYGDPGSRQNNRTFENLISDYRDPKLETKITFEFSVGKKIYRIERTPTQTVENTKGKPGKRDTSASLIEVGTGAVLAEKAKKVSVYVAEELLGLDREQFFKVVILQQGRFREFLQATVPDRQALLRKIFGTEQYLRVYEILKTRDRNLAKKIGTLEAIIEGLCENAGVDDSTALISKIESEQLKLANLIKCLPPIVKSHQLARAEYTTAKATAKKFTEFQQAVAKQAKLSTQKVLIDSSRIEFAGAQRAAKLVDRAAEVDRRLAEQSDARQSHESAVTALRSAASALKLAKTANDAAQAQKSDLGQFAQELKALHTFQQPVADLKTSLRAQETALRSSQSIKAKQPQLEQALQSQAEKHKQGTQDHIRCTQEATGLAAAAHRLERCQNQVRQFEELIQAKAEESIQLDEQTKAMTRVHQKTSALQDAREAQRVIVQTRQQNLAAELAASLETDQACPVCGSTAHPEKASQPEDAPSDGELVQAEKTVASAESALDGAKTTLNSSKHGLAKLQGKLDTLGKAFGTVGDNHWGTLEAELKVAMAAHLDAESAQEELKSIDQALAAAKKKQVDLQRESNALAIQLVEQETKAAQQADRIEAIEGQVPNELRDENVLLAQISEKQARIASGEKAIEDTSKKLSDTQSTHSAKKASETSLRDALEQKSIAAENAQSDFQQRLKALQYDSKPAFENDLRSAEEIQGLKASIETHDRDVAISADRLKRAQTEIEGMDEPNLADLAAAEADTATSEAEHRKSITRLETELKRQRDTHAQIQDDEARTSKLEQEHEKVAAVARALGGSRGGNLFEAFVLGYLFDEILRSASHRLFQMSNGRYQLFRAGESVGESDHISGLDLELEDINNGKRRASVTFSGGEGFLASLSLALGLADVAMAESGGRALECVFIDEGFGTLEPEDVTRVIKTLTDLSENKRLVGLVSHVETLRTLIPVKLEFEKTGPGTATSKWAS